MSLVALHNGGGVGIGKAVNGGFGMVCDGSDRVDAILRSSMLWDVMGGVARAHGHVIRMPWKHPKNLTILIRNRAIISPCRIWQKMH